MAIFDFFHFFIVYFVKLYKFIEVGIYGLFQSYTEREIKRIFKKGGIIINGKNPWDIRVLDKSFYARVASQPSLGLGECYMEKLYECDDLEEFSYRIFRNGIYKSGLSWVNRAVIYLTLKMNNLQTKSKAWEVGEEHYDLGNDLFESFLDSEMNYSCGYWKDAKNLEEAQQNKMELIAKKLKLRPGLKVLDIGCGWGNMAKYLAEKYHVKVVGLTISKEGATLAKNKCINLPVDIRVMDYRDLDENEKFDRILSVGMFEHVGVHNYRNFFEICHRNLTDTGILLLHSIAINHFDLPLTEPWTHTYIFRNGQLPYISSFTKFSENLFIMEDWHNFGYFYSLTLKAWYEKFIKAWPKLSNARGERFFRMWKYYLQFASAGFRSRKFQLYQIVFSKDGLDKGYESIR